MSVMNWWNQSAFSSSNVCCDGRWSCRRAPWPARVLARGWGCVSLRARALASQLGRGRVSPPDRALVSQWGWWWSWSQGRRRVGARGCAPGRVGARVRPPVLGWARVRRGGWARPRVCRLESGPVSGFLPFVRPRDHCRRVLRHRLRSLHRLHRRNCWRSPHLPKRGSAEIAERRTAEKQTENFQ